LHHLILTTFLVPDHSSPLVKQLNCQSLVPCRFQGRSNPKFNLLNLLPALINLLNNPFYFSEFDIAGVILYVGNMYLCNNQKRQWLFITDGSKFISEQKSEEQDCLLAVSFSSPTTGEDSALFSNTLSGNTVCDILIVVSVSQVSVSYFETPKLNTYI